MPIAHPAFSNTGMAQLPPPNAELGLLRKGLEARLCSGLEGWLKLQY
jgi:hypothetical protein